MKSGISSSFSRSFPVQGLGMAMLLIVIVLFLRRSAFFAEQAELPFYDLTTRLVWPWKSGHPGIALVTIQDQSLGWPLSDEILAAALERLLAAEPAVIGIDLLRDKYLDGPGSHGAERLERAGMDDRVVWVEVEASADDSGIPPPPFITALQDEALKIRKVTSATFPTDGEQRLIVRRGKVASWENDSQRFSLSAMLAWRYVENKSSASSEVALQRLFGEIGTLSCTAGGYWLKDSSGECTIGGEFLLKPISDAARRFRDISFREVVADPRDILTTEFPVFSLSEIMDDTTDPAWIRQALGGKIVLLGTHDYKTAKDEIAVVGDPTLRGLKLHALTTAQILRELAGEKPIRVLPDKWEDGIVWISGLLALAVLALPRVPLPVKGVVAVLFVPALVFATGLMALKSGIWLPTAAPVLAGSATGIGGLILLWRKTSAERRIYLKVMNSHLGPEVTARVLARNDLMVAGMEKPPETFEASALFGDLLGYSAASQYFEENHTPGEFFAWLNGFLGPAAEITGKHGGFVKQFAGDGIYLIFGFPPASGGGHAQRAVDFANELACLIPNLNRDLAPGLPHYHVRIGIYTGNIHASSVGGTRHRDFSFLGPTINKAARLESIDKERFDPVRHPVRILISHQTRRQLNDPDLAVPYREGLVMIDKRLPPEPVWEIFPESLPQVADSGPS